MTKITFIGAGSTIFMKNIIGDALHFPALRDATIALMDIDQTRLGESELVARKLVDSAQATARVETYNSQRAALEGADFVVVAFQIGGYKPCTLTDFDIPKRYGVRQTIADTLGVGGIMRGLRTVPHLWSICEDMRAVCPNALMLQYVNPTLQFLCAVVLFAEPFSRWHQIAFALIWAAVALFSLAGLRQDRLARRAARV